MKHVFLSLFLCVTAGASAVFAGGFTFENIDGGELSLSDFKGKAVLVVNTASKCGFTGQLDGLQTLYDTYKDQGLVVLAVPSDDFRQELNSNDSVKEFCEVNYNLTLPMTVITPITGDAAHPFYKWLKEKHEYSPRWNFYKVLLDKNGDFVEGFTSVTRPLSQPFVRKIEAVLNAN